MHVNCC